MNTLSVRVLWALIGAAFTAAATGETIHVDADATGRNDGTSWASAFTSPAEALEAAAVGDDVWVAEGTYGPIELKSGVKIIGGFAGSEGSAAEADPYAHKTYISGSGKTRAVTAKGVDAAAELRGFIITNGLVEPPDTGGGMYLEASDVVVARCVFTRNRSVVMGGALAVWGGSPTFRDCRFFDNDGGWGAGAVYVHKSASPAFTNCLFHGNRAWEAGAVGVVTGAPTFTRCTFADNQATKSRGGAIYDSKGEAVLRDCILWSDSSASADGAEIHNKLTGATTKVANCNIEGGWPGDGNASVDPGFIDPAAGDYRLRPESQVRGLGADLPTP